MPNNETVIYVPGTGGSQLNTYGFLGEDIEAWAAWPAISFDPFSQFSLMPDGHTPLPPDGKSLHPGDLLKDYFKGPLDALAAQLTATSGRKLITLPFDWRWDIAINSEVLFNKINQVATAESPCTLVGFSQGGLLCRLAWSRLVDLGRQNLVRRLITIGTPHQGGYSSYEALTGKNEAFGQIQRARALGSLGYKEPTVRELSAVVATWPSIYEMLPLVGGSDAVNDPDRIKLFNASSWNAFFRPSQAWLNWALTVFQPVLLASRYIPPASVLTTAAGTGFEVNTKLVFPGSLGSFDACGAPTNDGDGTFPVSSCLMPDGDQWVYTCRHIDLIGAPVWSGDLVNWINDPRAAPTPPRPAIVNTQPVPPTLFGPPFPDSLGTSPPGSPCRAGKCPC